MKKSKSIDAEKLVMQLMAISGRSGKEGAVMEFITKQLRAAGVPETAIKTDSAQRRSPFGGEVGNLACVLPGTVRGGRRMLMAHADTVPLCQGAKPVKKGRYVVPADKETALGADDRAGCAVILATALEIIRRKLPHPPLTFLWTIQEEVGLYGARNLKLGMLGKPRMVFNFDGGSSEKMSIAATGGYRMEIEVEGIASHAGVNPQDGVSAIAIASLAIADLQRDGWLGLIEKTGRRGTANVGVFHGGDATNVITPLVQLRAEVRSHDSAFRERIRKTIERTFQKAAKSVKNAAGRCGKVRFEGRLDYEAFKLADDDPSMAAAETAIRAIGGEPLRAVTDGGLDANWMSQRGLPTVTLGCGQQGGHTVAERLDLDEFQKACRIAMLLATDQ